MGKIKIVGCGNSGRQFLNRLIEGKFDSEQVDFYLINSDEASLKKSKVKNKILIGNGLGCACSIKKAKKYLEQANNEIKNMLIDTDLLILTTGMGGGMGTAAVCEIAKIAKEQNIPTIAVITKPFVFEGLARITNAEKGITELKEYTNTIFVFKNDNILSCIYKEISCEMLFSFIDNIIDGIITSIIITIKNKNHININTLKNIIKNSQKITLKRGVGLTIKEAFNNAVENNSCGSFDISETEKMLLTVVCNENYKKNISDMKILNTETKNKFPNNKLFKIQYLQQANIEFIQIIMILSF